MPETRFDSVKAGEASESLSMGLAYDHTDAAGAQWTGSLGLETVLAVAAVGPKPTAFQAGLNRAKDGWTIGGALALTDNDDGTQDRGYGFGFSRQVTEKLSVSLGVNRSESRAGGARLDESSLALIGLYMFVPDRVMVDAGIWQINSSSAGARGNRTVVGLGMSLYF